MIKKIFLIVNSLEVDFGIELNLNFLFCKNVILIITSKCCVNPTRKWQVRGPTPECRVQFIAAVTLRSFLLLYPKLRDLSTEDHLSISQSVSLLRFCYLPSLCIMVLWKSSELKRHS